jgi:hypothetical protein
MRREFSLPDGDVEGLTNRRLSWETFREGGRMWLLVEKFPLPEGFNVEMADVGLHLPGTYPQDEIDMAYFYPPLQLKNGAVISATSILQIEGRDYQQWSRHRTQVNPWRSDQDNVDTHLQQVTDWLEQAIRKNT